MTVVPDYGIQKVVIPKSLLPKITPDATYAIRYRVSSEDGSSVSDWSPQYVLKKDSVEDLIGDNIVETSIKSNGTAIDISWKTISSVDQNSIVIDALDDLQYDVFVSWSDIDTWTPSWSYAGSTISDSISVTIPEQYRSRFIGAEGSKVYTKFYFVVMVHLSTTTRNVVEKTGPVAPATWLFQDLTPMSTEGVYDSGDVVV